MFNAKELELVRAAGVPLGPLETTTSRWYRGAGGKTHFRCNHYRVSTKLVEELSYVELVGVKRCRRSECWYRTGLPTTFTHYDHHCLSMARVWQSCEELGAGTTFDWIKYTEARDRLCSVREFLDEETSELTADGFDLAEIEAYVGVLDERLAALVARQEHGCGLRESLRYDLVRHLTVEPATDLFGPGTAVQSVIATNAMFEAWKAQVLAGLGAGVEREEAWRAYDSEVAKLRHRQELDESESKAQVRKVDGLLTAWRHQLDEMVDAALAEDWYLVALDLPVDRLLEPWRSAVARYSSWSDRTTIVALPQCLVVDWRSRCKEAGHLEIGVIVGPREEDDTELTYQVFLGLWDPQADGPISARAAMTAARNITHSHEVETGSPRLAPAV